MGGFQETDGMKWGMNTGIGRVYGMKDGRAG